MKELSKLRIKSYSTKEYHLDRHAQIWWDLSVMGTIIVQPVNLGFVIDAQEPAFVTLVIKELIAQSVRILTSKLDLIVTQKNYAQMIAVVRVLVTIITEPVTVFLIALEHLVILCCVLFTAHYV